MRTEFRVIPLITLLLLSLVFAPTSHAALTAVGPVDPATTFPAFYQDSTGLSLAPCFDNNGFCANTMIAAPGFDPALPLSIPLNFPGEGFYFFSSATTSDGTLFIAALEFSFANGVVRAGDQVTFARIRFTNKTAPVGTYTITHPYGVDTVTVTAADVAAGRGIRFTEDIGVGAGIFTGALTGRVGPYLRNATGLINAPDGNVYIGNSVTPVAVTGTPVTTVTVAGPVSGTANTFILEGKVIGMSITPTSIAFPAQRPAPFVSAPVPVTVGNLSSASTLTIGTITALGANAADFQVVDVNCLTGPVAANGTCTFNVVFSGAAAGPVARTASVEVAATLGTVPKVTVTPVTGIIDAIPPSVLSTFPTTSTAPVNINMTLTFSEPMDPATINATTFKLLSNGVPVPGTPAPVYNDANRTASIALPIAQEQAAVGTVITAQVTTGMTDVVGNPLVSAVTFSFTASAPDRVPPTIALFDPPDNATGVEANAPISVTFSEPMLATAFTASVMQVTSGGIPVDGTVTVNGDVATFTPARPLSFGTAYTVTITTGALDLTSNALAAGQVINFVTNFAPLAPEIVSPLNGATALARPVVLQWKPSVDQDGDAIAYHLFYCNNQNFIGTAPNCVQDVKITPATAHAKGISYASVASGGMLFTLFGLSFAAGIKGRKKILLMVAVLIVSGLFIASCSKSSDTTPAAPTELSFQVNGLSANVTYYWKMEADDGKGGVTATPVMTFTTQ
jgi:Big-like domain-containing protein